MERYETLSEDKSKATVPSIIGPPIVALTYLPANPGGGSSGKFAEAVLCKVSVVGEGVLDRVFVHQGEAGAIGEAVGFVFVCFEDSPRLFFVFRVDP